MYKIKSGIILSFFSSKCLKPEWIKKNMYTVTIPFSFFFQIRGKQDKVFFKSKPAINYGSKCTINLRDLQWIYMEFYYSRI